MSKKYTLGCMRILLALFIYLALSIPQPSTAADKKPIIHDAKEAERVLGRHLFTGGGISYIGDSIYQSFGDVSIWEESGLIRIKGEHENYYELVRAPHIDMGGYIRIDGVVTEISSETFIVEGTIEYYGYNAYRFYDMTCKHYDRYRFSKKNHNKYWRLQNSTQICKPEDDPAYMIYGNRPVQYQLSVDIFTAQLTGEPPHGRKTKQPNPEPRS